MDGRSTSLFLGPGLFSGAMLVSGRQTPKVGFWSKGFFPTNYISPWNLTELLKIAIFERRYTSQTIILTFLMYLLNFGCVFQFKFVSSSWASRFQNHLSSVVFAASRARNGLAFIEVVTVTLLGFFQSQQMIRLGEIKCWMLVGLLFEAN